MLDKFEMQKKVDDFLRGNGILFPLGNPNYYFNLEVNQVCLKEQTERSFEREKNVLLYAYDWFYSSQLASGVAVYFCVSPFEEDISFYLLTSGDAFSVYAYVYNEAAPWCSELGFVTVDKDLKVLSL